MIFPEFLLGLTSPSGHPTPRKRMNRSCSLRKIEGNIIDAATSKVTRGFARPQCPLDVCNLSSRICEKLDAAWCWGFLVGHQMPPPYWMIRIYVEPNTKFKSLLYIYIYITYSIFIIYITPRNLGFTTWSELPHWVIWLILWALVGNYTKNPIFPPYLEVCLSRYPLSISSILQLRTPTRGQGTMVFTPPGWK